MLLCHHGEHRCWYSSEEHAPGLGKGDQVAVSCVCMHVRACRHVTKVGLGCHGPWCVEMELGGLGKQGLALVICMSHWRMYLHTACLPIFYMQDCCGSREQQKYPRKCEIKTYSSTSRWKPFSLSSLSSDYMAQWIHIMACELLYFFSSFLWV